MFGSPNPVIANLTHVDPRSAALQLLVPEEAWDWEPRDLDLGPRQPDPVWDTAVAKPGLGTIHSLPSGFGRRPIDTSTSGDLPDAARARQRETHLHLVAAADDLRAQLDAIRIPSLHDLAAQVERQYAGGQEWSFRWHVWALVLALAVRGPLPQALRIIEVARAGLLRGTVDPTRTNHPDRVAFMVERAARLQNYAAWLTATTR
jgi:hypothetical protein